ncbi:magnesium transporter [Radiomyces spectabilis]|uniref:magnesium transporter n=1 Tax=Radiomyces spectabilis TaxID=64574 RepID=UPI00221E3F4A|nr:magnesium transporter [Radiomyces spectabilis]KAI8393435.1 magnesium transporter [Radiomyces spectabilis]
MLQEKYIGLILAMSSSVFIGLSFIITKKGLINVKQQHHGASAADGQYHYLRNWTWWAGMGTMAVGEVLNFSAYSFAPPILVTPLGALSVITGAIFASVFLKEKMGSIGKIGCLLSVVGAVIVVVHAPEDKEVTSIEELLFYALQPAFLIYVMVVISISLYMIYKVVPKYGKKNPFVYISICSLVGSVSVMAIKAFGIAVKLTFAGNNQFTHPSTYAFGIVVAICILTQMNYFNKALEQFSTNVVNPIYFCCFTTATLTASVILFRGFNTDNPGNIVSLICGFIIIISGVYLLDSIAQGAGAERKNDLEADLRDSDDDDESTQLLMGESTLTEDDQAMGLTEFTSGQTTATRT